MNIHLIAVGGAVMHNLALALQENGHQVTGSDDRIYDPARSRLERNGLLPDNEGWDPERIKSDLDLVILGMHARKDNPELQKAVELKIPVLSYPEFIYEHSREKNRVVVGGSHGKTSVTSMIMHVLKKTRVDFDYLVGAQLEGFDTMVKLTDAPVIVLEGDEYLSSPIDRRPKFHLYKAELAVLTGIEWDHMNVFPTEENYLEQFREFIRSMNTGGTLIYFKGDSRLDQLVQGIREDVTLIAYDTPDHEVREGKTFVHANDQWIGLEVFGKHNLQNMEAARLICRQLGIDESEFYNAISDFHGAGKRLQTLYSGNDNMVFRDFAHAPSKLEATVTAVKDQFPSRKLLACYELHTFSSLNKEFLNQYEGKLDKADTAVVFFDPSTVEQKKLARIERKGYH